MTQGLWQEDLPHHHLLHKLPMKERPQSQQLHPYMTRDVSPPQRPIRAPNLAREHLYLEQGSFPLRQYPTGGVNQEGQPAGYYWAHTPFSTSDLLNWKNSNPLNRDDPQRMADIMDTVFATHHLSWADV